MCEGRCHKVLEGSSKVCTKINDRLCHLNHSGTPMYLLGNFISLSKSERPTLELCGVFSFSGVRMRILSVSSKLQADN